MRAYYEYESAGSLDRLLQRVREDLAVGDPLRVEPREP